MGPEMEQTWQQWYVCHWWVILPSTDSERRSPYMGFNAVFHIQPRSDSSAWNGIYSDWKYLPLCWRLKVTGSRDFLHQVFLLNHLPPDLVIPLASFRIFKIHHRCQRHPNFAAGVIDTGELSDCPPPLKRQCHEIFDFRVIFMNQFPPSPWVSY